MRNILFILTVSVVIWSACSRPDNPDPVDETPVFSLAITSDSTDTSWTAGVNGRYLFTRVNRGADNVLVMSGAFADASCPTGDCPGSFRFEFRNSTTENFAEPQALFFDGASWDYRSNFNDPPWLKTVAVQWVKPNGVLLRSDFSPQPIDSFNNYFNVLGGERWEANELGDSTWKMDVNFSCWLYDSIHTQETRVFGTGTIAVGYK